MKSVLIALDIDLHRRLKMKAAEEGVTIKDFLIDLITTAVTKGGGKK